MYLKQFFVAAWIAIGFAATMPSGHRLVAAESTEISATVFKTPEDALQGVLDAIASGDNLALARVVGPRAAKLIKPVCAKIERELGSAGLKSAAQGLKKESLKIQSIGGATDRLYLCKQKFGEKTVFSDSFTELVKDRSPTIPDHIPDLGTGWVLNEDTSDGKASLMWQVYATCHKAAPAWNHNFPPRHPGLLEHSFRMSYYAKPNPALTTADYYVQLLILEAAKASADKFFTWVMLRRTAADTYYGAGWYSATKAKDADDSFIFKVIDGKYTQLSSARCKFVDGSILRFEAVGDTLTLYKDGVKVLSAEGGKAITAIGEAGFGAGNIRKPSDTHTGGQAIDNFDIVERVPVTKEGTWENASPITFVKVADGWKIETKLQGFCRFFISGLPGFMAHAHGGWAGDPPQTP